LKVFLTFQRPVFPAGFKEHEGPVDVRLDEGVGGGDAPIHVGFRREVNHPGDLLFREKGLHRLSIRDVPLDEAIAIRVVPFNITKVGDIAGIGQLIQVDYMDVSAFMQ